MQKTEFAATILRVHVYIFISTVYGNTYYSLDVLLYYNDVNYNK